MCKRPSEFCRNEKTTCEGEKSVCDGLRGIIFLEESEVCSGISEKPFKNLTLEMCTLMCLKNDVCQMFVHDQISEECFLAGSISKNSTHSGGFCYRITENDALKGRKRRQLFSNPLMGLANLFVNLFRGVNLGSMSSSTSTRSQGGRSIQFQQGSSSNSLPMFSQKSRPEANQCGRRSVNFEPPSGRQGRIINGRDVPDGALPWQVGVKWRDRSTGRFKHICGGSIISATHVLSAAHCVVGYSVSDFRVVVGGNSLLQPGREEQILDVGKFIIHENYNRPSRYNNDVAVIRLSKAIRFGNQVQPICLPPDSSYEQDGRKCIISGWGITKPWDETSVSRSLLAATVPIMNTAICRRSDYMGSLGQFKRVENGMICAGYVEGGTDSCQGDSGGPLACNIGGRFYLLGIISWGEGCAVKQKPGVYTRVSYYLNWIRSKIS
ncbi:trypsin-1-like isoform X2 [Artemia franciscana]